MHETPSPLNPVPQTAAPPVAPWWHTVLIVCFLAGISLLGAHAVHRNLVAPHHLARYGLGVLMECTLLLLVWWGLRIRRVPVSALLGFRSGLEAFMQDLLAAGVFWIAAVIVLAIIGLALKAAGLTAPQKTLMSIAPRTPLEVLLWVMLSCTAGFCEEVAFRGYLLRQFSSLGAGLWLGVLCSSLLFGISHGYEGAAGMIAITAYGAMFCMLAISRKSLRPGMFAHAWHDIFSGLMLALLRHFHPL